MSTQPNAGSSSRVLQPWNPSENHQEMDGADDEDTIFRGMSFEDTLEELIARFMVNLPREETTPVRLYWQAEQAHWFYDDYLRPLNPALPPLSQKHFSKVIIASSPLYSHLVDEDGLPINYDLTWDRYTTYKRMVPTCGVVLINAERTKTLLVRHFGSKSWSWPRGKINEREAEAACAVRELEEETGYDCSRTIDPQAKIQAYINGQSSTMFFVTDVDENFPFAAKTRNEIEETRWVNLQDLPTWSKKRQAGKRLVFFKVAPFVHALKHFLLELNKGDRGQKRQNVNTQRNLQGAVRDDASVPATVPVQSIPAITSNPISEPVTALDKLFANFMHGQEADLQKDGPGGDEDNRDGIGRLFGNASANEQTTREEKEDDALARLLGAIGSSATPAPSMQAPIHPDPGRARLLSVLNEKTSAAPQHVPTPPQDQQTPKPHAASLLAMLAPAAQSFAKPLHSNQTQHVSLPTTPRPPSTVVDDRTSRQRALLDLTLAGLSLDPSPARSQPAYGNTDINNPTHQVAYDPPRGSPPQLPPQQQFRPPAPPAAFPPSSGAYYSSHPAQPPHSHNLGQSYTQGHGQSPPRNRGAPPPYESHYGAPGPAGPVRPMPPAVPTQSHDYNSHPQGYYTRPQPPIPAQGSAYRPHVPTQPYNSGFQQACVSPQNQSGLNYNGGPTGYQAASHRPPPHQGQGIYHQQHLQQQQQPYIPSVQGQPSHSGGQTHHIGTMHQPIPKSGPGGMLAMLNDRR